MEVDAEGGCCGSRECDVRGGVNGQGLLRLKCKGPAPRLRQSNGMIFGKSLKAQLQQRSRQSSCVRLCDEKGFTCKNVACVEYSIRNLSGQHENIVVHGHIVRALASNSLQSLREYQTPQI